MHFYCLLLFTAFFVGRATSAPNQAPWKSWTFCKKQDPNINNECLIKAVEGVAKDLVPGNSYFGTAPIQPLHIDELSLYQANRDTPVALNITFKDCNVFGLATWQLTEMRADWDAGKLFGRIKLNGPVEFISQYNINGKVILLPITGQGKSNITFEGLEVDMKGTVTPFERKNKKYFKVESFDTDLQPKKMIVHFENLFNGNNALSDNTVNNFLNENWQAILNEVKKPVSEGLGAVFKDMAYRVFAKIPIDKLVPE